MGTIHDVYDSDTRFIINPITRAVKNESSKKTTLIQKDHNSERFSFEIDRYIEGHDMSLCNKVEINYINIDSATKEQNEGLYVVEDLQIDKENEEKVVFSWLITEQATMHAGLLSFLIMFRCMDNAETKYRWSTAINNDITVSGGIDNGNVIAEEYADVLAAWEKELFDAEDSAIKNIENKAKSTMAAMEKFSTDTLNSFKDNVDKKNTAMTKHANDTFETFNDDVDGKMASMTQHASETYTDFNNDVDEKAARTLASIPEDYSDMDAEVKDVRADLERLNNTTTYGSFDESEPFQTWAGMNNAIFIRKEKIANVGFVKIKCYNSVVNTNKPYVFVLLKKNDRNYTIVDSVEANPTEKGYFTVEPNWYISEGYYIGVYRNTGSYLTVSKVEGTGCDYKSNAFSSIDEIVNGVTFTMENSTTANTPVMTIEITQLKVFEELDSRIKIVEKNTNYIASEKYIHFSVDDCVFWLDFLEDNQNPYNSIFDNYVLGNFKKLHDEYGIKVTLNCFCTDIETGKSIANVSSAYAKEFKENSDWLKFAFHAEDKNTYYDSDKVDEITTSYNTFVSAIYKMTGTTDCIDRVTRLGFYTGTSNNVLAIKNCNCGVVGLLSAEDNRKSYYLSADKENYVKAHGKMADYEKDIVIIRTLGRLENGIASNLQDYLTVEYGNINRYVEFFTHEYILSTVVYSYWTSLRTICEWVKDNNYQWGYMQSILKL